MNFSSNSFLGVYYRNRPVRASVDISNKRNSALTIEAIQTELYTVVVYDLMMCMKEDNPSLKYYNIGVQDRVSLCD